jgi:transposase
MKSIIIGLDIGKSVFQVHAEDCTGKIIIQKRLRRSQVEAFFAGLPPSLVGIEACGSAHHWARTLRALGHEVRLIPAAYVKPFVKRNKTDARDAAAICAALRRPDMRFVAIKSIEQQASRGLERSRDLLVKQHTQLRNCVRSQLAELGIIAAQGRRGFAELTALLEAGDARIPPTLVLALRLLVRQIEALKAGIVAKERIMAAARDHPVMRRLAGIPGVGGLTAMRSSPRSVTASPPDQVRGSARPGTSPPGAASHHGNIRAPASGAIKASRARVRSGCANCSRSAPAPSCATPARASIAQRNGSAAFWPAGR